MSDHQEILEPLADHEQTMQRLQGMYTVVHAAKM